VCFLKVRKSGHVAHNRIEHCECGLSLYSGVTVFHVCHLLQSIFLIANLLVKIIQQPVTLQNADFTSSRKTRVFLTSFIQCHMEVLSNCQSSAVVKPTLRYCKSCAQICTCAHIHDVTDATHAYSYTHVLCMYCVRI